MWLQLLLTLGHACGSLALVAIACGQVVRLSLRQAATSVLQGSAFAGGALFTMLAPLDLGAVSVDGRTVFIGLAGAFVGWPGALICAGAVLAVRVNFAEFTPAGEILAVMTPLCLGMLWSVLVRRAWGVRFASLAVLALFISATLLLFFFRYPLADSITLLTSSWPLIFGTALVSAQVYGLLLSRELGQIAREQILAADANADPLTGILNRRGFSDRLEQLRSSGSRLSLIMIDADKFKTINDTHGHPAGDAWLVAFARVTLTILPVGTVFARLGGEEFAIILVGDNEVETAAFSEQVRSSAEFLKVSHNGETLYTTVSIGISHCHSSADQSLLQRADKALYFAKAAGRNTAAETLQDGTTMCLGKLGAPLAGPAIATINAKPAQSQRQSEPTGRTVAV